jgi:flagellar biosynthetic protein FliP
LWSTAVSLAVIVGAIVLVGRWMQKRGFQGPPSLPIEAFEILGRRQIEPRVAVQLVKCGERILVLCVTPQGVRTLSEIRDPAEVERLIDACDASPSSSSRGNGGVAQKPVAQSAASMKAAQRLLIAVVTFGLCIAGTREAQAQVNRKAAVAPRVHEFDDVADEVQPRVVNPAAMQHAAPGAFDPQQFLAPQHLGTSLKVLAFMTVLGLAPSILMMTTCFVRFTVSFGLLRQALGIQQGLPNQVTTAICLFMTFLVMSPVWQRCYQDGIRPFTSPADGGSAMDEATALAKTMAPVRQFMSEQIEKAGNADAVWMLLDFQRPSDESPSFQDWHEPQSYDDVPFSVLAPAYLLSELKVGFLIGFQLFLPFLVIDLVVAAILTSLGLTSLQPSMVSIPFKVLLFVLIDGWFLTVGMLLESVRVV